MSKNGLFILTILLLCLVACDSKKPSIITYELSLRDFNEKIHGIGTLQSANNLTISVPRVYSPMLKVLELAPEGSMAQEGDTVCLLEASDIYVSFDNYYKELEKAKVDLRKQEADNAIQNSLLDAQLRENKITKELNSLDSIQLKFAPPVKKKIMELELEKSEILEQKILKKVEAQKKINEQAIRALKSQIMQKEQLVQRYQDMLNELIVIAPKDGMVVYSTSPMMIFMSGDGGGSVGGKTTVGSSVFMDAPLIELPDLDSMEVSLMLQEADYKRVQKGQKVLIRPESLDGIETTGTVKSKSLAGRQLSRESKVKSFEIIIDLDSLDNIILPGLSANCEIIVQNVKDTLVVPSISVFERDSAKIVYVFRDDLFEKVEIETGLTNGAETIISKGLKGSEIIALIEPPNNLILKPKIKEDD